jgi:hypothetical protein
MDTANQILLELNGRVQAGDVDGGMAALSKIKVSSVLVLHGMKTTGDSRNQTTSLVLLWLYKNRYISPTNNHSSLSDCVVRNPAICPESCFGNQCP